MIKRLLLVVVVVAVTVAFALNVGGVKDACRFQIWLWTHPREAEAAKSKFLVLSHWNQWGFAG